MDEDTELEGSKAVERATINDAQTALAVVGRDLRDIEGDIAKLCEVRDTFLKCLLCSKYMPTPLFVDRCNHAFCQACLVYYLQQQCAQSAAIRHRCPAEGCEQLLRAPPSQIPMVTALAGAIRFATCGDRLQCTKEWCSGDTPTFEGLFP
ncbi:hypothetical protein PENSPDRAFT_659029 [Peniophora sp. CONT]|nr:hypothetical protein PENSPDRAFT_659029 [Peniophora sp. CONT]